MSGLEVRRVRRGNRRVRLLAPLAIAAVAVATVIAVPASALAQAPAEHAGLAASSSTAPGYLIMDTTGLSPLQVRNVKTGALTGLVTLPAEPGAKGLSGRAYVTAVATGNGRSYVASAYRPSPCRSWLYQFQLNSKGKPSAVTAFRALPTIGAELYSLTVSANGKMLGYAAGGCVGAPKPPAYVAVTNIATKHTTQWPVGAAGGGTVSLTATGSQLCYVTGESTSEIRIIPTSATPGPAAERSRVVAQPAQFGPDTWIPYAVISPGGQDVYFTTYTPAPGIQQAGQVRVLDLAASQTRVLHSPAGEPAYPQADPGVDHLLLQIQAANFRSSWLVNLDLATGKITKLPSGMGDVLSW